MPEVRSRNSGGQEGDPGAEKNRDHRYLYRVNESRSN